MALNKRNYVDNQTIITAQNLNDIQDNIIQNAELIKKVAPRNLLDNSDFRKPVNQRGIGITSTRYARPIDRWQFDNGGKTGHSGGYDPTNRYMKLDATGATEGFCALYQAIAGNGVEPGDYTVAFHAVDFSAGKNCQIIVQGDGATIKLDGNLIPDNNGLFYMHFTVPNKLSSTLFFGIYALPGRFLYLDWCACYKGTYTAETMPEYQPKGYENELLMCRQYDLNTGAYIGLCKFGQPRNLLDNADFTNPVDQRKSYYIPAGVPLYSDTSCTTQSSTSAGARTAYYVTSTYGYTYHISDSSIKYYVKTSDMIKGCVNKGTYPIDRWRYSYDGDTQISSCAYDPAQKCIVLKNTNTVVDSRTAMLYQLIPISSIKPGTYTVAIHTKSNVKLSSLVYIDDAVKKSISYTLPNNNGLVLYTLKIDTAPTKHTVLYIYASAGDTVLIDWVAMYEGEYTHYTLPEYQPKGYGAELAECMRYYQRVDSHYITGQNTTIQLSPAMRALPTVVNKRIEKYTNASWEETTDNTVSASSVNCVRILIPTEITNIHTRVFFEVSADL